MRHIIGQLSDIGEGLYLILFEFHTKGLIEETLEANHVERVEADVGNEMVTRQHVDALFLGHILTDASVLI